MIKEKYNQELIERDELKNMIELEENTRKLEQLKSKLQGLGESL